MKTKFDVGEEIDLRNIKGIVKRINIDERGACYTIIVKDSHGRESDLYIDENVFEAVNKN